jgi:hypothetical protein
LIAIFVASVRTASAKLQWLQIDDCWSAIFDGF